MKTLLTRISDVFEISSLFIPKEDLIHMYLVYPLLSRAPLTRIRFRMKAEISSPVWPIPASTRIRWKRRSTKTHLFKNSLQSGGFLKMPICCIRVDGWNRRVLITITSRCWIPLCRYSYRCVFVWKGKYDSKTQLKDTDFSQNGGKKTNPFSDRKGYLWKGQLLAKRKALRSSGRNEGARARETR